MKNLPTGTVTFLFTDVEESTTLLQRLGDRRYAEVLAGHHRLLREAFAEGNGQEVDTQGDAFLVVFSRARDALGAAVAAQRALTGHDWPDGASLRVRMGMHTGEPVSGTGGYVGLDVHRAARICSAGHGGQVLLSQAVGILAAAELPPDVSLRDLGAHRLKDLREPEHLFQVVHPDLPTDFPPLKSLDVIRNNLPRQLTSFVGREKEMAEVKGLLPTTSLLTLTGAGGCGKTRLALQVATDLIEHYRDGVWLAQLASLSEPTLVPKAVASALGVPDQASRPLTETLVDYLRPKALLLVFDNCEHLLQACAQLVDALLQACPNLRILATSREALGIAGELTYRVPSLSLPDLDHLPPPETLTQYEAVRLFAERAAFSKPGFQITGANAPVVAKMTHRLDGIPLAIELAAARVKALPIEVIAERLDDRFRLLTGGSRTSLPRHQTLRAVLDWSFGLLAEQERVLWRRLSVCAGGFTLAAAEKICAGPPINEIEVLDLLTHLVDKSLVVFEEQNGTARYRLLETVRQYGLDRLIESGETAVVRIRHLEWYLALAEQAYPELFGPRQGQWLDSLEAEHDNFRAALGWCETEPTAAEPALRLTFALNHFWHIRGHWREGQRALERALANGFGAPPSARVRPLAAAAFFASRQGDYEHAMALAEQGLRICGDISDDSCVPILLFQRAIARLRLKDYGTAEQELTEVLRLVRQKNDETLTSSVLSNLAYAEEFAHGNLERSEALRQEALRLARLTQDKWSLAFTLYGVGGFLLRKGDLSAAQQHYAEALRLSSLLGDKWVTNQCLDGFASIAGAWQHHRRAARLLGASEALGESFGITRPVAVQTAFDALRATLPNALGDGDFQAARAEGRSMTLEQAIEYALATETG